jgi:large subunit ribosomal protein L7Ae
MPAKKAPAKKGPAGKGKPAAKGKKGGAKGKGPEKKITKKNGDLPIFESKKRDFGTSNDIPPKRDLSRFMRWPKYVKIQRQRRVLQKRIRVPPALNQFNNALDKNTARRVFTLLDKYRPEDKTAKKARLLGIAEAKAKGVEVEDKPPANVVKYGLNHVTGLIEQKKAKLVLIAHDVEPIELVVWLPALCKRMGVPYAIVKSKSRLGQVVHQKKVSCLAIVSVDKEDMHDFSQLQTAIKESYLDRFAEINKKWGGTSLGRKSVAQIRKKARAKRA